MAEITPTRWEYQAEETSAPPTGPGWELVAWCGLAPGKTFRLWRRQVVSLPV